jgi:hypothetical protein
MVAPAEAPKLYLPGKITLPFPTTPETTIPENFTPGFFVARVQVCTGFIESQHLNPERAIEGLDQTYIKHREWDLHDRRKPCTPTYPIPLLQIFTNLSTNQSIIRPVEITSGPEEEFQTTVFELPEKADPSFLYAVELPKAIPRESFWNQVRKLLKI